MNEVKEMTLVGFYNFSSKDKTKRYFVFQVLSNDVDISNNIYKSNIINIFVNEDIYKKVSPNDIGKSLNVNIQANLSSGKIYYSLVD